MTDPSKESPIEGRDWSKSPVPQRQCTAHKKNGDQCKNSALRGATVCKFHGGAAKHVRNAARARLANAADRMAKELLNMATDEKVSDAVKLNAIRDALDRAGLKPGIEVEIGVKPVDQIIDQIGSMHGGSREAYRRGIADGTDTETDQHTPALASSSEPLDAEIVDDDSDVYAPLRNQQGRGYTVTPDGDVWPPTAATALGTDDEDDSLNPFATSGPPPDAMMSRADAYAAQADYQRRIAAERQADALAAREAYQRERAEQKALPPGRLS